MPGDAWLEWTMEPSRQRDATLVQKARFHPRGVWGRAYWYAMLPFHRMIFRVMAERLAAAAISAVSPSRCSLPAPVRRRA